MPEDESALEDFLLSADGLASVDTGAGCGAGGDGGAALRGREGRSKKSRCEGNTPSGAAHDAVFSLPPVAAAPPSVFSDDNFWRSFNLSARTPSVAAVGGPARNAFASAVPLPAAAPNSMCDVDDVAVPPQSSPLPSTSAVGVHDGGAAAASESGDRDDADVGLSTPQRPSAAGSAAASPPSDDAVRGFTAIIKRLVKDNSVLKRAFLSQSSRVRDLQAQNEVRVFAAAGARLSSPRPCVRLRPLLHVCCRCPACACGVALAPTHVCRSLEARVVVSPTSPWRLRVCCRATTWRLRNFETSARAFRR